MLLSDAAMLPLLVGAAHYAPPLTPRHAIAMLSMLRRCHASAAAAFDTLTLLLILSFSTCRHYYYIFFTRCARYADSCRLFPALIRHFLSATRCR
jgi:hypothetical protein